MWMDNYSVWIKGTGLRLHKVFRFSQLTDYESEMKKLLQSGEYTLREFDELVDEYIEFHEVSGSVR